MSNQVKVTRVSDATSPIGDPVIIYRVEYAGEFIGTVQRFTHVEHSGKGGTHHHFVSIGTDDITLWYGTTTRKQAVQRLIDKHLDSRPAYYNQATCSVCPARRQPSGWHAHLLAQQPHNPVHAAYRDGSLTQAAA